jgi:hypothetical protein
MRRSRPYGDGLFVYFCVLKAEDILSRSVLGGGYPEKARDPEGEIELERVVVLVDRESRQPRGSRIKPWFRRWSSVLDPLRTRKSAISR